MSTPGEVKVPPKEPPKEESDPPISQVLSLLVLEDDRDIHLRQCSIMELFNKFLREFSTPELISFALDAVVGYIERARLNSRAKLLAAFGILMNINNKFKNPGSRLSLMLSSVIYAALKYGCTCPIRNPDNIVFNDLEIYVLSRLLLAEPSSNVWLEKLEVILRRWEDEVESLANSNASVMDVVQRDLASVLEKFETALVQNMLGVALEGSMSSELRNDLLTKIDILAGERKADREKIEWAHRDEVVNDLMKNLLSDWNKHEKFLEDPSKYYVAEFVETVPHPLPSSTANEMLWIVPNKNYRTDEDNELTDSQILMNQAFTEALNITQRQELIDAVRRTHTLSHFRILQPSTLHDLVEYNPAIAIEVLVKLISSKIDVVKDYLEAMVNMEMSVHSMEVINRLTGNVDLPREFLYLYVSNCIKTCERIQDKYVQNRLVRLLCVFLQALIRNQVIDIQDIYVEVIVFLLAFSRIREAAALFRLIRHVESEDPELREMITKKMEDNQNLCEVVSKSAPTTPRDRESKS